jgi:hypothetical protein
MFLFLYTFFYLVVETLKMKKKNMAGLRGGFWVPEYIKKRQILSVWQVSCSWETLKSFVAADVFIT